MSNQKSGLDFIKKQIDRQTRSSVGNIHLKTSNMSHSKEPMDVYSGGKRLNISWDLAHYEKILPNEHPPLAENFRGSFKTMSRSLVDCIDGNFIHEPSYNNYMSRFSGYVLTGLSKDDDGKRAGAAPAPIKKRNTVYFTVDVYNSYASIYIDNVLTHTISPDEPITRVSFIPNSGKTLIQIYYYSATTDGILKVYGDIGKQITSWMSSDNSPVNAFVHFYSLSTGGYIQSGSRRSPVVYNDLYWYVKDDAGVKIEQSTDIGGFGIYRVKFESTGLSVYSVDTTNNILYLNGTFAEFDNYVQFNNSNQLVVLNSSMIKYDIAQSADVLALYLSDVTGISVGDTVQYPTIVHVVDVPYDIALETSYFYYRDTSAIPLYYYHYAIDIYDSSSNKNRTGLSNVRSVFSRDETLPSAPVYIGNTRTGFDDHMVHLSLPTDEDIDYVFFLVAHEDLYTTFNVLDEYTIDSTSTSGLIAGQWISVDAMAVPRRIRSIVGNIINLYPGASFADQGITFPYSGSVLQIFQVDYQFGVRSEGYEEPDQITFYLENHGGNYNSSPGIWKYRFYLFYSDVFENTSWGAGGAIFLDTGATQPTMSLSNIYIRKADKDTLKDSDALKSKTVVLSNKTLLSIAVGNVSVVGNKYATQLHVYCTDDYGNTVINKVKPTISGSDTVFGTTVFEHTIRDETYYIKAIAIYDDVSSGETSTYSVICTDDANPPQIYSTDVSLMSKPGSIKCEIGATYTEDIDHSFYYWWTNHTNVFPGENNKTRADGRIFSINGAAASEIWWFWVCAVDMLGNRSANYTTHIASTLIEPLQRQELDDVLVVRDATSDSLKTNGGDNVISKLKSDSGNPVFSSTGDDVISESGATVLNIKDGKIGQSGASITNSGVFGGFVCTEVNTLITDTRGVYTIVTSGYVEVSDVKGFEDINVTDGYSWIYFNRPQESSLPDIPAFANYKSYRIQYDSVDTVNNRINFKNQSIPPLESYKIYGLRIDTDLWEEIVGLISETVTGWAVGYGYDSPASGEPTPARILLYGDPYNSICIFDNDGVIKAELSVNELLLAFGGTLTGGKIRTGENGTRVEIDGSSADPVINFFNEYHNSGDTPAFTITQEWDVYDYLNINFGDTSDSTAQLAFRIGKLLKIYFDKYLDGSNTNYEHSSLIGYSEKNNIEGLKVQTNEVHNGSTWTVEDNRVITNFPFYAGTNYLISTSGEQQSGMKTRSFFNFALNLSITSDDYMKGADGSDPGIVTMPYAGKLQSISLSTNTAMTLRTGDTMAITVQKSTITSNTWTDIATATLTDADHNKYGYYDSSFAVSLSAGDRLRVWLNLTDAGSMEIEIPSPQVVIGILSA